jgi:2-polyprenyl-3-methyl-5-hydroxy-6-metoxy-1,4-benzoquinol methylase
MTDLFEAKAADWDASNRKSRLASAIGDTILRQVALDGRMDVLDFGAGTGLIASRIAPEVNRVVAVDTSPAMLAQLESKPELKGKVETVCQDILDSPLETKFDLIVSAMALHHVEDTDGLLARFSEQLKDAGMVALADLDQEDGSFHPPETEGVFHFGFDREALGRLMQKHGFREIEFVTAHTIAGDEKDYPVFLVTARK